MSAKKTVKCTYKHCCHKNKDIPREEAVKDNGKYYHKDCYKNKKLIDKIKQVWEEKIDPQPNYMRLTVVLNNLAFNRGIDLKYILYVVNLGAKEKWLKHPEGLYAAVDNEERYKKWRNLDAKKELEKEEPIDYDNIAKFVAYTYIPPKKKDLADILG